MRTLAGLLVLAAGMCAPAWAADADVLTELFNSFSPREQRLIYAVTADPALEGRFGADYEKVKAAKNDPEAYQAAKLQFQLDWLGRINDFSEKYRAGDPALKARMARLPKANLNDLIQKEEAKARAGDANNLAWFVQYDRGKWKGKLLPAVWAKVEDPHMLEYSIAGMRAMTAAQKEELFAQLKQAEDWWLSAEATADEILKKTKQEFIADLGQVGGAYAERARAVREQLAAVSKRLENVLAKGPGAARPEDLADAGKLYDNGAVRKEPPPVSAGPAKEDVPPATGAEKPVADKTHALTPPGEGDKKDAKPPREEPPSPAPPASSGFSLRGGNSPSLKADENFGKTAPKKEGFGSKLASALRSPKVMSVGGGILGGILGFLFGGPIGAAIGIAAGALLATAATRGSES